MNELRNKYQRIFKGRKTKIQENVYKLMPLNKNMKFKNHNSGVLDYPSNKKAKLLVYEGDRSGSRVFGLDGN